MSAEVCLDRGTRELREGLAPRAASAAASARVAAGRRNRIWGEFPFWDNERRPPRIGFELIQVIADRCLAVDAGDVVTVDRIARGVVESWSGCSRSGS